MREGGGRGGRGTGNRGWGTGLSLRVTKTVNSPLFFDRRDRALCVTGGHLGFKCSKFSLGMSVKST